jgi:nitroimidazol reductase NimA-like FMN-containing flavoprotein (pyridoxamine 5'-phosphate oxidase superfamily)
MIQYGANFTSSSHTRLSHPKLTLAIFAKNILKRNSMQIKGAWSPKEVEDYLAVTVLPARISVISPNNWPIIVSLWFFYENGALHCATKNTSRVAQCLSRSNRCAFEIARDNAPYFGVRGQGKATLISENGDYILSRLADRYLGKVDSEFRSWLMSNTEKEIAIRIDPTSFYSWDYRKRMKA